MPYILRLFVYDKPDRSTCSQLGEDKKLAQHPSLGYGTDYNHDGQDYIVADIPRMKSIPDPDNPNGGLIKYDVYLAKMEEWSSFEPPAHVAGMPGRRVE